MKTLIIGAGEVGKSLYEVLKEVHETFLRDKETDEFVGGGLDVLNICFPYFNGFEAAVRGYQKQYNPRITIVHSTVPVGTCRTVDAIHSPIHGKHPYLASGIRTFVKYVGSSYDDEAVFAAQFLEQAGIKVKIVSSPEASEASKLWCTTQYGWNIVLAKEVKNWCEENQLPFDEVYGWNNNYNEGYAELGMPQFHRPVLDPVPGKIGGHCVINNAKLLDSWVARTLREKDNEY